MHIMADQFPTLKEKIQVNEANCFMPIENEPHSNDIELEHNT